MHGMHKLNQCPWQSMCIKIGDWDAFEHGTFRTPLGEISADLSRSLQADGLKNQGPVCFDHKGDLSVRVLGMLAISDSLQLASVFVPAGFCCHG